MDHYINNLELKRMVEEATGINDIATSLRTRHISDSRFVYYGLCKRFLANFTFRGVGASVDRDHATVMYGLKQFNTLYETSDWFGKYLFDLLVYKITNDNYVARLKDKMKNKKRKCNTNVFAIQK